MRAELPWNVAGIPPEAREAARAAARREGLSVGEWLTRHILHSFSGLDDEHVSAPPEESPRLASVPLDSWGLPQSAARDSEEMLARVGHSENESVETWRRIEEQLRGIGHRLASTERGHSESNRFLSRTAQEMNSNARVQAQAFEQLGQTIRGLRERLERLERNAAGNNIREAIKALHLGLSRLADQLTATAGNSAGQLAQVTANLEKLASHVGKVREDTDNTAQLLNQRIDLAQTELAQRLKDSEQTLDARLSATEKTVQFNTNALDHALEKIETAANERAAELAYSQRRSHAHEESVRELKDSLVELEARLPGLRLEARLNTIERSVGGLKETVAQQDSVQLFGIAVQSLSQRLERLEKDHAELIEELRAGIVQQPVDLTAAEASPEEAETPREEPSAPSLVQEQPVHEVLVEEPIEIFAPESASVFAPEPDARPRDDQAIFAPQDSVIGPAPESLEVEPYPDFDDAFVEPEPEDLLAQARRYAHAASERAESERMIRLSTFRGSQGAADREDKARPRFLIPALVAALVVMVAGTALVLSERANRLGQELAASQSEAAKNPVLPAPPANPQMAATPAPEAPAESQTSGPENDQTGEIRPSPGSAARTETAAAQSRHASQPAAKPVPDKSAGKIAAPIKVASAAGDRVARLANAGNPVALAILGLRALDGSGSVAVNLPDAIKYLTQAADKGQAVAQYRLGTLYERGQGVAADSVKAVHWYELAANQGNRKAMHNLAVAYASGPSAKRNMTESARWFAKAAALGLADSQFNLAVLYERGEGVPQSLADAYKWYAIAALSGDAEAKARMGVLETQLNESDRRTANKSAASFRAAPLIRSVNVPPEPADLGT